MAKAFAAAGAHVACVARREPELKSLVEEIEKEGGKAIAIVADVAAKGAAQDIVKKTESGLGPVDILISNAAISRIGPVEAEPEDLDLWWRVYEVNVRAPVALARAVLPGMKERKSGVIITVGSTVASMALPVMTAYASSKAAIAKFHEGLAVELQDTGILSFVLNPGLVATELGKPTDAINKAPASMEHPATQAFLGMIQGNHKRQEVELSANTLVTLCAEERCRVLDGRFIPSEYDVEEMVKEAEKEGKGRIGKENMYLVRIAHL